MNAVCKNEASSRNVLDTVQIRNSCPSTKSEVIHAELKWTIENLSSFPLKNDKYCLSPNFVLKDTTWNLAFHPRIKYCDVDKIALNIIRNVSDSGPDTVPASYRLGLQNADNKVWFKPEEKKKFGKGDSYGFETSLLGHLEDFLSDSSAKNEDSVSVLCEIYVWYSVNTPNGSEWFDDASDIFDFDFWRDILSMYCTLQNADISIKIPMHCFRAHKCVLCARSRTLSRLLEDKNSCIQLNCTASCLMTALRFMYSGNYSYLAKDCVFSIGLYELAWELSLSKLKELLTPHKIEKKSKIVYEKSEGVGKIEEFQIGDILKHKVRKIYTCFNRTHNIGLQFTFQSTENNSKENMDCHVRINGLSTALAFRFDFYLLNKNVIPHKIVRAKYFKVFGFRNSAFYGILTFSILDVLCCLQQLQLCVYFNFETTTVKHLLNASVHRNNDEQVTSYESDWLENMSSDFKVLYDTGEQSDFTLKAEGEIFKVHCSILMARSEYFRRVINFNVSKNTTREILNMDPKILKLMFTYLYCGKLTAVDEHPKYTILQLYDAAEKYEIKSLIEESEGLIESLFDPHFVYDVLAVAQDHGNSYLMGKCLNYVANLGDGDNSSEAEVIEEVHVEE